MKTSIKSKVLNRILTFSVPGSGHIYVDLSGKEGMLGDQICRGGKLRGDTLSAFSEAGLARAANKWLRAYIKQERANGRIN